MNKMFYEKNLQEHYGKGDHVEGDTLKRINEKGTQKDLVTINGSAEALLWLETR